MPSCTTQAVIGQKRGVPPSVLTHMTEKDAYDLSLDCPIFLSAHLELPSVTNASRGSAAGQVSTGAAFAGS